VDDAREEAVRLVHGAEDSARDGAAARVAAAHEDSRKALEADMGSLSAELDALAEKARQNQDSAVNAVLAMLAGLARVFVRIRSTRCLPYFCEKSQLRCKGVISPWLYYRWSAFACARCGGTQS
jgi:cell division protein FtsB